MKHLFRNQFERHILAMLSLLLLLISLITLFCSVLITATASSNRFYEMLEIQQSHCPCAGVEGTHSSCCGRCSCTEGCYYKGTCCLDMFTDFENAQSSLEEVRYTCVNYHYQTNDNGRYQSPQGVWMITTCPADTDNPLIKHYCENPGSDGSFESMIPVSYILHYETYRNRYCAYCNNINMHVIRESWSVEISCDDSLSLMTSELLTTAMEQQCRFTFIPPVHPLYDECTTPEYTIADCPESEDDIAIVQACNSYVDPFNGTYKNYFCYLCNVESPLLPQDWTCPEQLEESPDDNTVFRASFNLDNIRQLEAEERLDCRRSDQYLDYKKGICREIRCSEGRQYLDEICKPDTNKNDRECLEVYLRLKPKVQNDTINHDYVLRHELDSENFIVQLRDKITKLLTEDSDVIQQFSVFVDLEKVSADGDRVNELVVYMLLDIPTEKETEIYHKYEQLQRYTLILYRGSLYAMVSFLLTIELFNISRASDTLEIDVHTFNDDNGTNTTVFNSIYDKRFGELSCVNGNRQILQYNILTFCPHITLGTGEFGVRIENGDLQLIDNELVVSFDILPYWKYEIHPDGIDVCLGDYVEINYYMLTPLLQTRVEPTSSSSGEFFDLKKLLESTILIGVAHIFLKRF